jgi:hypothetical protein
MPDKLPMSDAQHRAWCADLGCRHPSHRLPRKVKPADKPKCCVHRCLNADDPRVLLECVNIPKPIRERCIAERAAGLKVGDRQGKGGGVEVVKRDRLSPDVAWGIRHSIKDVR